jgi:hypothetical protein
MRDSRRLLLTAAATVFAASLTAGPAAASEIVGRNARDVHLGISRNGKVALVTFRSQGSRHKVRAWGAINARSPSQSQRQVEFQVDFSGGKPFQRTCRRYDGPKLQYLLAACKASDGSYWAVQQWPRIVSMGKLSTSGVWELRLSHWTGATAQLAVKTEWTRRKYDNVYGQLTYRGEPVHGFSSTHQGAPLDTYGRNIYLDTFGSSFGAGWHRANGFLARRPTGGFCYTLYEGKGSAYRASTVGPGVTPDVFWQSNAPGPYDQTRDLQANAEQRTLVGSTGCY